MSNSVIHLKLQKYDNINEIGLRTVGSHVHEISMLKEYFY